MSALLLMLLVTVALIAWLSIFFFVPGSLRGMFESRLHTLRDQLGDEIRADSYQRPERAQLLREQIKQLIDSSDEISVGRIFLLRLIDREALFAQAGGELAGLAAGDEPLLRERALELQRLLNVHARWETPSGWLSFYLPRRPLTMRDTSCLLGLSSRSLFD